MPNKQPKHRYRVNVYLGKEAYDQMKDLADVVGLPVATMTRVIIETGLQIARQVEKGEKDDGSK